MGERWSRRVACDLAPDVANEPAEAGAQYAQLSTVAVELFGMGITPCHHGGALGDAHIRRSRFADVTAHLPRFGEGFELPSPLVTYACPAASAEQVCSPVNIALHERAHPVPKIEVQRENALSAHKVLIGLRQQIGPLKTRDRPDSLIADRVKCERWKDAALDHNVVVGETGHYRRHENAIA